MVGTLRFARPTKSQHLLARSATRTALTSSTVGIDGAAPIRCTQIETAAVGVFERVNDRFAAGKLRGKRADKAIARAGGVDCFNLAAGKWPTARP